MSIKKKIGGLFLEFQCYWNYLRLRKQVQSKRKFLIFAQGRSGSTLLASLLKSHTQIYCFDELLFDRRLFPKAYIIGRFSQATQPIIGCHIKIYQLINEQKISDPQQFILDLVQDGWQLIYLRRADTFRHAASPLIAKERNLWHVGRRPDKETEQSTRLKSVKIEPAQVLKAIKNRLESSAREREVLEGLDYLEIVYEEDLLNAESQQKSQVKICKFLNVQLEDLKSPLKKTTTQTIRDAISNYQEIKNHLNDNGFGEYINEEN